MHSRLIGNVLGSALLAIVFMSMLSTSGYAQTTPGLTVISESDNPGGGTHQIVVHSALVGRDFVIVVSPPPMFGSLASPDLKAAGAAQANQKLPAIYALDGGYGMAGSIVQRMVGMGTMSPAYVVSVGYGEGGWHDTDLLYRSATEGGVTYGGGGAKFRSFLIEELRPFLEARYPLDPGKAILFGHSFSGVFAANVLADSPKAFEGYVIASPSMWIDRQVLDKLSRDPRNDGRRVFIAVGDQEEPRMLDGVDQLLAVLPSGSIAAKKVFAGGDPISYYPQLVPAAFRWLLPPVKDQ
ncbi:MAG TPA: alpha/beta hydrolase-fold protein [Rhizomicrobium sp.]|nr:alpha/beta hydrolase-fold protein [Rhizomicrobium sp.]